MQAATAAVALEAQAAAVEAREVSHATRSNCPLGVAAIARQAARQRWHKVLHCAAD